ncbi:MAG: hypothetical protein RI558_03385 [Psychroflexus sp.]|jgi:uncharacterized membrane protein SirB2|nr:hypothetical protein [Psychroflexus sp.]MDR9448140.1 hypothetical protein [Psychroflexus sp.]
MFSTGQWIFAGFFVVAFSAVIAYTYLKDKALHKKYYKRSYYILLGFLAFVTLLLIIKFSG